jgi:hypothetical protein
MSECHVYYGNELNAYTLFYSQIQDFDLMRQRFLSDCFGFLNLNEEKKTWDFFIIIIIIIVLAHTDTLKFIYLFKNQNEKFLKFSSFAMLG